jgi:hypothetical protein
MSKVLEISLAISYCPHAVKIGGVLCHCNTKLLGIYFPTLTSEISGNFSFTAKVKKGIIYTHIYSSRQCQNCKDIYGGLSTEYPRYVIFCSMTFCHKF